MIGDKVMTDLTKADLRVGNIYAAKRPNKIYIGFDEYWNDRQIIYLSDHSVQYDGPSVAFGRNYPTVSIEKFLKWVKDDVTAQVKDGEWRRAE